MHNFLAHNNDNMEYLIYIYYKNEHCKNLAKWKKMGSTCNIKRAIKYAKLLCKKDKYEKIEIKKICFSAQKQKSFETTIATYKDGNFLINNLIKSTRLWA